MEQTTQLKNNTNINYADLSNILTSDNYQNQGKTVYTDLEWRITVLHR